MSLKDVMTKSVITCGIDDDIVSISRVMKKYDIGFVVLVDEDKVVGCLTDRDLVVRVISNNDYRVVDYFTSIISVPIDSSISDVLFVMKDNKIKRVIVSDNGRVVGVISISDLFDFVDSNDLINTIKTIWAVDTNIHKPDVCVDDFYL